MAPATPKAEEETKKEPVDYAALARAKQQAEDAREPLSERLIALQERAVEQWARDDLKTVTDELAAGDARLFTYQQRREE